jgi:outer membrane protein
MRTNKFFISIFSLLVATCKLTASEMDTTSMDDLKKGPAVVVNFTTCIAESKYGKKEQENFEYMRKQMTSMLEETEKELKNITAKFEDQDYMEGLSPKAEEELRIKYQSLNEELARYQQQFYQTSNQANYQLMQKMHLIISKVAEKIAKRNNYSFVINREACFFFADKLDITENVIKEMDLDFDFELKNKKAIENKSSKK